MSTLRRNNRITPAAPAQLLSESGPAATPNLYDSAFPLGISPNFQKMLQDYIRRFRPAGLVETNLVRHLASIEWRIRRLTSFHMDPDCLLNMPASHFRYYTSLISMRSTVFRTLCRIARPPRNHVRTQMSSRLNHIEPEYEPHSKPVGLHTNPGSGSFEPGKPASVPPNSPHRLD